MTEAFEDRRGLVRVVRALALVVSAAGLAFVARAIAAEWTDASTALRRADAWWLAAAVVLAAAGMSWIGLGWGFVIRHLGSAVAPTRITALYFRGEVAKYVPGGLWAVIGRGELARREGVAGPAAYSSVLLSLGALYVSCAVVAACFLPWGLRLAFAPVAVLAVVAIGVGGLHPRVLGLLRSIFERVSGRSFEVQVPSWSGSVRLVLAYVPAWLSIGTATWAVVRALAPASGWPEIVLATTTSWLLGFLAIPVPGGIGIREAIFVATVPSIPTGTAAAAALLARIMFMFVDGAGAAASYAIRAPARSSVRDAP